MTTFVGFNTQGQYKKFTLVDSALIKRDLLNAFNIRQGQLPGRPEYGTVLWNYVFESQTNEVEQAIMAEVQRVAGGDPRLIVTDINIYPQQNGILLEVQIQTVNASQAEILSIFFNEQTRNASYV